MLIPEIKVTDLIICQKGAIRYNKHFDYQSFLSPHFNIFHQILHPETWLQYNSEIIT